MPITTRMKKSGRKRVYDQKREGVRGELNGVAREIFTSGHREVTRGPAGMRDPVLNEQTGLAQELLAQRRRRTLASVRRQNMKQFHKGPKRLTRVGLRRPQP
ncbi:MAG TPA: hypothetical protein VG754_07230 [Verrucomicrobiae bacterium]|jgi:hypothetical protein|nr:hypothetical protein [Verrucomicrobiae bacterium]